MAAIVRRSPRAVSMLGRQMDIFDEMASEFWNNWASYRVTSLAPRMDVYEEKDELVVRAELPGVKKDSLDISIDGDMLTIKGEKKQEEIPEDANLYTCERSYGTFSRIMSLPFSVDFDKISSVYENGVLEIRLPKSAEVKPRHIEVKVQ